MICARQSTAEHAVLQLWPQPAAYGRPAAGRPLTGLRRYIARGRCAGRGAHVCPPAVPRTQPAPASGPPPRAAGQRLGWLDALRGIAARCVVFDHLGHYVLLHARYVVYLWFDPGAPASRWGSRSRPPDTAGPAAADPAVS